MPSGKPGLPWVGSNRLGNDLAEYPVGTLFETFA